MAESAVFWLNALPINSGMSCTISTQTLMTGTTIDSRNTAKLNVAHTPRYTKNLPRNSAQSRTEPAIYLEPTGNLQVSYWFLSLRTGRQKKRRDFTPLPVLKRVIYRVHALVDADNQNATLDFFDQLVNPIPYGDTPNNDNEDNAGYPTGVEEYENQMEILGITAPYQEEITGVSTPEEE